MSALVGSFRALKPWQAVVLAAVFIGAVASTYAVYAAADGNSDSSDRVAANEQIVAVQRGNLTNAVSTSGSVVFPERAEVRTTVAGAVQDVLVQAGQQVEEGQELGRMDPAVVAGLQAALAKAQLTLRDKQWALDEAKDIEAQTVSARAAYANAQSALAAAQDKDETEVRNAEEALTAAEDAYRNVFERWLGVALTDGDLDVPPADLLDRRDIDLASLFATDQADYDISKGWFSDGPPPDDPATAWSEPIIYAWLNFYPGALSLTCEAGVNAGQGYCIQDEFDQAWDDLQGARTAWTSAGTQTAKAVSDAEKALAQAQRDLADVEADVEKVNAGQDTFDVMLAKAEVVTAEADVQAAQERLDGVVLRAPMSGVVVSVGVEAGENAAANTVAFEIVDPTVVELSGAVDEIDILYVSEGAQARVTLDALTGQVLQGEVSYVAPVPESQQGVVSYPIRVRVQAPDGVALREGLSGTASIVLREERDVLLIPNGAVRGTFAEPTVRVLRPNGRVEEASITLGSSDEFWVVVGEGLSEGDQVVMPAPQAGSGGNIFGGPNAVFTFGGGPGGNAVPGIQPVPGGGGGQRFFRQGNGN